MVNIKISEYYCSLGPPRIFDILTHSIEKETHLKTFFVNTNCCANALFAS